MPDASQLEAYGRLLRLTPIGEPQARAATQPTETAPPLAKARTRRWPASRLSFLLLVILPTCIAAGYLWLVAANRYEAEARFTLRVPGQNALNAAIPAAATGVHAPGISRASDDGYVVQEFLKSRDAMQYIVKSAGLRAAVDAGNGDPLWRFPNLVTSDTEEGLYSHYQRLVSTEFDSSTGISTLRIEAFTPADANRLAKALLDAAEGLVNRLNDRSRKDAIEAAQREVDGMTQRTVEAQAALTAFRERERLVDPGQSTTAVIETIARLSVDVADVSVQINELTQSSPKTPLVAPLRNRRAALEAQIVLERQRLAGDAKSIAPRIVEYERLMLERDFAQTALIAAMTALEQARVDAQRQQIYLERIAEPSRPDYPAYPLRIVWTLVVLVVGFMTYRMWCILSADTRRHADP